MIVIPAVLYPSVLILHKQSVSALLNFIICFLTKSVWYCCLPFHELDLNQAHTNTWKLKNTSPNKKDNQILYGQWPQAECEKWGAWGALLSCYDINCYATTDMDKRRQKDQFIGRFNCKSKVHEAASIRMLASRNCIRFSCCLPYQCTLKMCIRTPWLCLLPYFNNIKGKPPLCSCI